MKPPKIVELYQGMHGFNELPIERVLASESPIEMAKDPTLSGAFADQRKAFIQMARTKRFASETSSKSKETQDELWFDNQEHYDDLEHFSTFLRDSDRTYAKCRGQGKK